eukprot:2852556-Pleurochrysis_carterae.AAC.1
MAAAAMAARARLLVPFEFCSGTFRVAFGICARALLLRLAMLFRFGLGFGEQSTPIRAVQFEVPLDLPSLS